MIQKGRTASAHFKDMHPSPEGQEGQEELEVILEGEPVGELGCTMGWGSEDPSWETSKADVGGLSHHAEHLPQLDAHGVCTGRLIAAPQAAVSTEDRAGLLVSLLQDQVDTLTFQSQSLRDRARRFEEALRKNTEEQLEVWSFPGLQHCGAQWGSVDFTPGSPVASSAVVPGTGPLH